jgi:hypothetical protein
MRWGDCCKRICFFVVLAVGKIEAFQYLQVLPESSPINKREEITEAMIKSKTGEILEAMMPEVVRGAVWQCRPFRFRSARRLLR